MIINGKIVASGWLFIWTEISIGIRPAFNIKWRDNASYFVAYFTCSSFSVFWTRLFLIHYLFKECTVLINKIVIKLALFIHLSLGWDRTATIWTTRRSNLRGGQDFPQPSRLACGPPSLLYIGYQVSFPGVKQTHSDAGHLSPSSSEDEERIELYFYLSPPRAFLAKYREKCTFFTFSFIYLLLVFLNVFKNKKYVYTTVFVDLFVPGTHWPCITRFATAKSDLLNASYLRKHPTHKMLPLWITTVIYIYIYIYTYTYKLRYKSEGRGFDSRWFYWNFSLT
jgi:hypothetical protein